MQSGQRLCSNATKSSRMQVVCSSSHAHFGQAWARMIVPSSSLGSGSTESYAPRDGLQKRKSVTETPGCKRPTSHESFERFVRTTCTCCSGAKPNVLSLCTTLVQPVMLTPYHHEDCDDSVRCLFIVVAAGPGLLATPYHQSAIHQAHFHRCPDLLSSQTCLMQLEVHCTFHRLLFTCHMCHRLSALGENRKMLKLLTTLGNGGLWPESLMNLQRFNQQAR